MSTLESRLAQVRSKLRGTTWREFFQNDEKKYCHFISTDPVENYLPQDEIKRQDIALCHKSDTYLYEGTFSREDFLAILERQYVTIGNVMTIRPK